jgi:peptide/nickel transport system permease protein
MNNLVVDSDSLSLGRVRQPARLARAAGELVRHPLLRVVVRRLVLAVPLLFVVTVLSFVLISLTPGDPALEILGTHATPETHAALRRAMGLNLPLYEQYWRWLQHAVQGDLGASVFSEQPVTDMISARLPLTLWLMVGALLVTLVVGVALGVFSAVRGGVPGRIVDAFTLVAFALPSFWIGAVMIALFAVNLRWLPATGYVPLAESPGEWLRSLVLPVVALALGGVAGVAKQTREAMLDVLGSEYIRMARASGVSRNSILFRHALKSASIPVVTVLGLQAVGLLGGTVLAESIFALPGLGGLTVEASARHDLPVVQGVVLYITVMTVSINLVIDLIYTWLNPRVRTS